VEKTSGCIQVTRDMICKLAPFSGYLRFTLTMFYSVYRVRSSSPDNQPLLIPFYKSPPQSSFPYRNALISSLPQQLPLQQHKDAQAISDRVTPPLDRSDRQVLNSGETRPLLEKAFVQLVASASYTGPQIENTKQTAAKVLEDAAADTTASTTTPSEVDQKLTSYAIKPLENCGKEGLDVPYTSEPGVSFSTARPHLGGPPGFDNQISKTPRGLPNITLASTDRVWKPDESDPGSVSSGNPSGNNKSSAENRDTSESLRLEPTEAVGQVLGAYRRSLYSPGVSNQNFWRAPVIQNESTAPRETDRGDVRIKAAPTTQMIAPKSTIPGSHLRRVSLEKAVHLSSVLLRLRPLDLGDRNDPSMSRGRKSFDVPPTLVRKSHTARPNEGISHSQSAASNRNLQDPEHISLQMRYSRALLFFCCLFPPMLIVLASGGMDDLMPRFTNGKVDNVGVFYKRVAFFMGASIGSVCCIVPIVVGILLAQGAL